MASKVSMVVPCYNKEKYIGNMLQSVEGQLWDNIEVLLVNDGSTDHTREIISEWEPRLTARGYEVVIIDQENGGCCAAVHAGLLRMTGAYYCLVDCDDEIYPEYVSTLAGFLDGNPDYEWAACNYAATRWEGGEAVTRESGRFPTMPPPKKLLEAWIMRQTFTMVWIYMARVCYLRKCGMPEHFYTGRSRTYEPLVAIPLAAGEGRLKYFNKPLYKYNMVANGLFQLSEFEKGVSFNEDYEKMFHWAIGRLEVGEAKKRRLLALAELAGQKELFIHLGQASDADACREEVAQGLAETLDRLFDPPPGLTAEQIAAVDRATLFNALDEAVFGMSLTTQFFFRHAGRIIGYGVLGKAGRTWLARLAGTPLMPQYLWDKGAGEGARLENIPVVPPAFSALQTGDILLVFPRSPQLLAEIQKEVALFGARALDAAAVLPSVSIYRFPSLYQSKFIYPEAADV